MESASSKSVTNQPTPDKASNGTVSNSPLRPYTSSSGFTYPAIWSFPPFFTLQPNPQTFAHQLTLWTRLILSWAKYHRVFRIDAGAADGGDCREVLENKSIGRRLLPTSIRQLVSSMEKEGLLSPDPPRQPNTFLIYWRKPEEWGSMIYDWVIENGMGGSIMTFYEITDGDMAHTTEFHQLPPVLLRRSLETLVKRGKAQIVKGEAEGVKFF
ncbi:hypothetical protein FFLO_06680 [Filobasidium floriforme]|uniref:ESCRT-II complex subunit VPS25 n=1 Tax=Filobasidium floriforme TaxID=5210 RepID=A0A8K0NKC8_9TREE|nr:ESCRT-II complex subunit-domain-containing protein [Filobasidium floriforme]KAG7527693.1 hypothetical protein FFLO_06680 [Filobasidium floriforme]KAH8086981.1 ESCRT-II complex subunit-domain-containing protein [Filobasidium floriforme]